MKKGFTLIELLAVIVILAIIAVIAVPIVLNIIEESKKSSILRSAGFYLDAVELSISQVTLKEQKIQDGTYNILESGNICLEYNQEKTECTNEFEVKVNGETPDSGAIIITKGNISEALLKIGKKTIIKNEKGELLYQDISEPKSFADDDWATIATNVKFKNLSKYNVGDKKEIALDGFKNTESNSEGLYTIRIANISNPSDCEIEGYSQTACGFVIEFEDIIIAHNMNKYYTSVGGYPSSLMYEYVQTDIYKALPKELKSVIIPTLVVSGHGLINGEENFISNDNIYLLSGKEVFGSDTNDSSANLTRQLDYYINLGVTTSRYQGAIKKLDGTASYWWLRSADSTVSGQFRDVHFIGSLSSNGSEGSRGVVVAFRIG